MSSTGQYETMLITNEWASEKKNRAMPSVHGHGGHSPFLML